MSAIDEARRERAAAEHDFKRQHILGAARQVFRDRGLDGASLRAIARAAGYTAPALYGYYDTKEQLYADVLAGSLADLEQAMAAAAGAARTPHTRARAAIRAFFDFYAARPEDLDLGLYLLQGGGVARRGLGRALDRQLNDALLAALAHARGPLIETGLPPAAAGREIAAAICHLVGCLLMERTGRLDLLGAGAGTLVDRYLRAFPPTA